MPGPLYNIPKEASLPHLRANLLFQVRIFSDSRGPLWISRRLVIKAFVQLPIHSKLTCMNRRVCNFCMKILVKDRPEGPTPSVGVLPPPTTSMYASPAPILALGPRRSLEYGPSRRPPVPSPSQSPSETGEWLSKAHSSLPRRLKQMYTSSFGDITEAAKFDDDIRTSSADVSVDSISVSDLADITSHEQYQSKKSDGEESQFVDDEWAASPFRTPPTGIVTSIDFSKALDPSIRSALPSKVFSQDTSYSGKKYGSLKRKSFSNTLTRTLPGSKTRSLGRNPSTASYSNQPRQDPVTSPGFPEAKSGKHQRSMSIPGHIEFNATSISHMKQMLHQILKKNDIPQLELWEPVIFKLLLKVCDSVNPDVRSGDDHDVRHYVKIKRIPGGVPSDSHYVRGVVFTKNVAHKKMIYPKSNPRILLLTFALEYQRVENEFISLGPLLAQEKEHLRNLVARVAAVKPDIVLVQKTVSRLALEFLLEAGIAVAYNIKPSVIEAMSRCTSADIISSIDKLALSPRLGAFLHESLDKFTNFDL